jgi:hypothetical protein
MLFYECKTINMNSHYQNLEREIRESSRIEVVWPLLEELLGLVSY